MGTGNPAVLAVLRSTAAAASVLVVNLSDSATTWTVPADSFPASLARRPLRDLITGRAERRSGGDVRVALPPFGVVLLGAGAARGGAQ